MDIRMIALDMDGTLLQNDHATISERNIETLRSASRQGVKIVLASGRTYTWMKEIREKVPFVDYILTSNGAAGVDVKTGASVFLAGMPHETWTAVYDILKKHGRFFEMYVEDDAYMEKEFFDDYRNDQVSDAMVEWLKSKFHPIENAKELFKGKYVEKICYLDEDTPECHQVREELEALGTLAFSSGLEGSMELNDHETSKGNGLSILCEKLGILPEQVMAFGDSSNDVTMLRFAGHSYAMANALDCAKQAAKYMAPSNMEDGVAQVVETLLK